MTLVTGSRYRPMAAAAVLVIGGACAALAQTATGVPNAVQGFSVNRDKPIQINSASLELRDKDKTATFLGNVHLVQGDTTMKCATLVVFYDQNAPTGTANSAARPVMTASGQQQIRRLEAKGGVVVTQKDQTATGETGIYDVKSNTMTLAGNVVVTQGQNVVRGDRLVVDLTSGVSRVECDKSSQCRVQGLFIPSNAAKDGKPDNAPKEGKPPPAAAKDATKPAPSQPLRIN